MVGAMNTADAWREEAACRGLDVNLFYLDPSESAAAAKAVCAECPIREACLEEALANREAWGIWGGKNERQRRRLRKERIADGTLPGRPRSLHVDHGAGQSAYLKCRRLNGDACAVCKAGHASEQLRRKQDRWAAS